MVASAWSGMRAMGVMPNTSAARTMFSTCSTVIGPCSQFNHHKIVADGPKQLHSARRVFVDDGPKDYLSLGHFGFRGIGAHQSSPILASVLVLSQKINIRAEAKKQS